MNAFLWGLTTGVILETLIIIALCLKKRRNKDPKTYHDLQPTPIEENPEVVKVVEEVTARREERKDATMEEKRSELEERLAQRREAREEKKPFEVKLPRRDTFDSNSTRGVRW